MCAFCHHGGEVGINALGRRNGFAADLADKGGAGESVEERLACDDLPERHAEGVLIRGCRADAFHDPLGRHVAERSVLGLFAVGGLREGGRKAEVCHAYLACGIYHQVGRLHVAVHDAAPMRVGKRLRRLQNGLDGGAQVWEGEMVEPSALEQFHGVVAYVAAYACPIDLHDVRMMELGDDP